MLNREIPLPDLSRKIEGPQLAGYNPAETETLTEGFVKMGLTATLSFVPTDET